MEVIRCMLGCWIRMITVMYWQWMITVLLTRVQVVEPRVGTVVRRVRIADINRMMLCSAPIRASRDRFYQQGPNGPVIAKEEISFDLQPEDQPGVSVATLKLDTATYNLADELAPVGFIKI